MLPDQPIDPDATFQQGDLAFREGDPYQAQRLFGLVYLHDPAFGQGMAASALNETCRVIGNDCVLVMGRLDLLRVDYHDQLGPREDWFPQQETDYRSILACFDLALDGRLDEAYGEGYRVINAPLPLFDQFARLCVDRVQAVHSQQRWQEAHTQAMADWQESYPGFLDAYQALAPTIQEMDWDGILDTYPQYKIAEEPILPILESELLNEDPQVGEQVARAAEIVEEVQVFEEDNMERYSQMREAITAIEEDPRYNQALLDYEEIHSRIPPLQDEIDSLRLALEATTGREHRAIERRIEAKEAEIREIRRDLRRIMGTINSIRRERDLPTRDAPYGIVN